MRSLLDLDFLRPSEAARRAAAEALARRFLDPPEIVFLNDLLELPQPTELRSIYDSMSPRLAARASATPSLSSWRGRAARSRA